MLKHLPLMLLLLIAQGLTALSYASDDSLLLTDQERQWLKQHPQIRLAIDIAWPPFEFIDSQQRYRGLAAEYMQLVAQRLGINFEVEKNLSWRQTIEAMKQRQLDVYSCVVETAPRLQYANFTRPYLSFPMVIVTRDEVEFIDGLSGLGQERVAVVDGYASEDLLRQNHPELNLVTTPTLQEALERVATGEIFAAVGNLAAISDVMRDRGLVNLRVSGQTPYRFELSMAVRNDWPEFVPILQKALDSITDKERDAIFERWIGVRHEYSLNQSGQWVLTALTLIFALLLVVSLWNRRLYNEIRSRHRVERSLRESEQRLQHAQQLAHVADWECDIASGTLSWSDELYRILGYEPHAFVSTYENLCRHIHPDDVERVIEFGKRAIKDPELPYRIEYRVIRKDGIERRLFKVGEFDRDAAGRAIRICGTAQDITELHSAYERLELAQHLIDNVTEAIAITDLHGVITDINPAYEQITGYSRDEVVGQPSSILRSGHHDQAFYQQMWKSLQDRGHWQGEVWDRRKSGALFPTWLTLSTIHNSAGQPTNYVSVLRDISHQKQAEEQLERLAFYDVLTQLPNRALFQDRLTQLLKTNQRDPQPFGLMFIDLDRFKYVNDHLGHHMGDLLLKQVAERFSAIQRKGDTIARMGGDEFTVIVADIDNCRDLALVANKLLEQLSLPFLLDGEELFIGGSIGIAVYPQDGRTASELTASADAAMYHAKQEGNSYSFFDPSINLSSHKYLEYERELRYALERQQFSLVYQPKVELRTHRVNGVEALIRWHHPDRGIIAPLDFIPLAEETGLIVPIGAWVLEEACAQAVKWNQATDRPISMAVNLSARQFKQPSALLASVQRALELSGLEPSLLELELTESMVMGNIATAIDTMNQLRQLGVKLAIDDFGTGYSSLEYLKRFPINTLKIDKSFVRDLMDESDDAAIVKAVISLAQSMNLEVVAEGIENSKQLHFLDHHQCQLGQGYLFSKPLPAEQLDQQLLEHQPEHCYAVNL